MSQQPQDMFYPYQNSLNRSPSSTRQGYASMNLSSNLGSGRPNPRQLDAIGQGSGLYGGDRFGAFDGAPRYDRMSPASALHNSFMLGGANAQAWGYNANAATVNGAMHDGGRLRSGNRRGNLPTEWMMPEQAGLGSPALHGGPPLPYGQPIMGQPIGLMNSGLTSERHGAGFYDNGMNLIPALRTVEEQQKDSGDLILTAIVIKNIPFNVRKETLTALMQDMNLPVPYAFNYHFDNGVFRGLAFANFQTAEDTRLVIEKMNQMEVGGRKLRVEYKKMLPEHERERIEREKREKRGQLEEQHRPMAQALQHQSSIHSIGTTGAPPRNSPLRDVDLNNRETLTFYTELTLFRNDAQREVLIFPNTITPEQRRQIHILAHNMGLEHQSIGDGEHRQLQVLKRRISPTTAQPALLQPNTLDSNRKGLSRAATFDFAEARVGSTGNYPVGRQMLEPLTSPDTSNGLRGVKSFADLRSFTPSPSLSQSSYANVGAQANGHSAGAVARFGDYTTALGQGSSLTTPTTPGGGLPVTSAMGGEPSILVTGMGSMSLGGFDTGGSHPRPRENPGAIGSQRPGLNGSSARNREPERQPRGPASTEWETSAGFGARGRANGHVQRGSDSSDAAARAGAGSGASFFQ